MILPVYYIILYQISEHFLQLFCLHFIFFIVIAYVFSCSENVSLCFLLIFTIFLQYQTFSDLFPHIFILLPNEIPKNHKSTKGCHTDNFFVSMTAFRAHDSFGYIFGCCLLVCSNIETALVLTSQQLGITFVPEIFARQKRFSHQVRYYSIRQFHDMRQICLVYRKNLYQHTQLSALIRLFQLATPELYRYCSQ